MDVLALIKKRKTVRKYKDKPIPKRIINKIIEAGIWGPSIIGIQPWRFVVIINKRIIKEIRGILLKKSETLDVGGRFIFNASMRAIDKAHILIAFYNSGEFTRFANKFGKIYMDFSREAEISAISAVIQNMILVAESLGIGSCWLHTPVFCAKRINKILNMSGELVAILTLGYPAEKGKRSLRKSLPEIIKYIQ